MALPAVGQAGLIADELARVVEAYRPSSVAVLGCAGGNGLESLIGSSVRRVVAVDFNPNYVATTEARFRGRIEELQAIVANVEHDLQAFEPVGLVYAALLLEYVNLGLALRFMLLIAGEGRFMRIFCPLEYSLCPACSSPHNHSPPS